MSKSKKYLMLNERCWDEGDVIVEMRITSKTTTITPVTERPRYRYGWQTLKPVPGCIEQLWEKGKIAIRRPLNPHRYSRHVLIDEGGDKFVLYPDRAGEPFLLKPLEGENGR